VDYGVPLLKNQENEILDFLPPASKGAKEG
jgi:hypothetical protein